jgi:hypothetical protein
VEQGPLAVYPYMFDTNAATVRVVRGGTVGALYRVAEGIYGVDISLGRELQTGETATLEYETTFDYRSAPEPEFRRAIAGTIEAVTIEVRFESEARPRSVAWADWDALDAHVPRRQEPAELDRFGAVHRYVEQVSKAIVGFRWDW